MRYSPVKMLFAILVLAGGVSSALAKDMVVDFAYRPHLWRTAICPPDDTYKTLVTEKGALVYHWGRLNGDFATSVRVVVDDAEKITDQRLAAPRLPIVQTRLKTAGLDILEEAFAAKKQLPASPASKVLNSPLGQTTIERNWAKPPEGVNQQLSAAVVGWGGPIRYRIKAPPGGKAVVAVGLCEGWHDQVGQRVIDIAVEGARKRTVDPVAELGKNGAGVYWFEAKDIDNDGMIDLIVTAAKNARDKNAILNAFWVFEPSVMRDAAAVLSGSFDAQAISVTYAGQPDLFSRKDFILVHVTNNGDSVQTIEPKAIVTSALRLDTINDCETQVDSHERILCTENVKGLKKRKADPGEEVTMTLGRVKIEPGKTVSFAVVYCGGGRVDDTPMTIQDVDGARQATVKFWQTTDLPYGHVIVPDKNIQALFDSSLRNIWQAREIKNGLPAFQVGATCYRGLWIVDGAFILEAAAILGAGDQARAGIAYEMTFQQPDGRFQLLPRFFKENGIVLWTWTRHARLMQDKAWLRSVWPRVERTVAFIKRLRKESYEDASPLNDGLIPPGGVDGGINGDRQYEYSNVYWNLTGLKAAIDAARWLGNDAQAAQWQREYDDFYATFRKCARRDMRDDGHGNRCLPILMPIEDATLRKQQDPDWFIPCKGQWAFCHGVYPGQLFDKTDPLVKGNLEMLKTYEKEGMVTTTGWLTGGIWNYFASFYGHAWLWQGDGQKDTKVLYAYANHASPLGAWIEEQGLRNEPIRENGDMPHNWASAEFIRLTVHLLALDRNDEMHLFEGLPPQWTRPGMVTQLDKIVTPFGPLTCSLHVSDDGSKATLKVEPLSDATCKRIVVHLSPWATTTAHATMVLDPQKGADVVIPIGAKDADR
ncbi:MAG: hypothetical protein WCB27_25730 [Thermoguttaceae bacterium]